MLGIEPRAARATWTIFLVLLFLAIIYFIRKVLLVFVLAVLFAYLLFPVVNFVDRHLPLKRSRPWALGTVYALLVIVLIVAGALIGNEVGAQASNLAKGMPKITADLQHKLADPRPPWLAPVKQYIRGQIEERGRTFGQVIMPIVEKASSHIPQVLSSLILVVLIPILSFFFLKDGRELREYALDFVKPERRPMWEDIFTDIHLLLGQFIRALVILSIATLAVYSIFFSVIGFPYGLLLAAAAAALEFIPVVGPFTAAVTVILVAAFSGYGHILVIIGFLAAYRIFQDYILNPHLMSAGVELHPLLVIFGALAGEEVAGIPGMFLSVPVLATLRVIYARIRKGRLLAEPVAINAPPPPTTTTIEAP